MSSDFDACPPAAKPESKTVGMCLACSAIEVYLNKVTGTRDFSHIGESAHYPTGYGCELCAVSMNEHTRRWEHHRQPLRPDPAETVTAADHAEAHAAAQHDNTWYVRVGGELVDADDVPALSDLDWD